MNAKRSIFVERDPSYGRLEEAEKEMDCWVDGEQSGAKHYRRRELAWALASGEPEFKF